MILNGVNEWLTPSLEEQVIRILKGLCPHNEGWYYDGHGHNYSVYKCAKCGEEKEY